MLLGIFSPWSPGVTLLPPAGVAHHLGRVTSVGCRLTRGRDIRDGKAWVVVATTKAWRGQETLPATNHAGSVSTHKMACRVGKLKPSKVFLVCM